MHSNRSSIVFRQADELGCSGALTLGAWPLQGVRAALRGSPPACPAAGPAALPPRHVSSVHRPRVSGLRWGSHGQRQEASVGDYGKFHPGK